MPYITEASREAIRPAMHPLLEAIGEAAARGTPLGVGVLNFVITKLVARWLGHQPGYEKFNAAVGVLEAVKLEMYRRAVVPYEDLKRSQNGDVYDGLDMPWPPQEPYVKPQLVPAQVPLKPAIADAAKASGARYVPFKP